MLKLRQSVFHIVLLIALSASVLCQTPREIENELLSHFKKLEQASNYGGSRNENVQELENKTIRSIFFKYGRRTDVLKFSFSKLREKIFISTSKDGRLRTYSWDDEGGGTMHNFYTAYQYRGRSGKVHIKLTPFLVDISEQGVGTFYHDIFQTDTTDGPIYILVSSGIFSTPLSGQFINTAKINGERFEIVRAIRTTKGLTDIITFEYNFFSVVNHPERPVKLVFYDKKTKSFRFPVVIEDKNDPGEGRVTDKFITYRFNGRYFVKVS